MNTHTVNGHTVNIHTYNTVIVGSGAAGMNCAVHTYEFMQQKGLDQPAQHIAVVTANLAAGASRMSGSDKQTFYKMGTSPETADSAHHFAQSLTAGGACHHDLALAEAIGSLREFYHLVQAGVPFPHDPLGSYVGYKTDHDPYERATSAGPKTSKLMSECLERQTRRYGIAIHDAQEVTQLLKSDPSDPTSLFGVLTIDRKNAADGTLTFNLYTCRNLVLAAGGPGDLYAVTVYPPDQIGIHGIAFRTGLAAENLTESQFGLASTQFRWNVSGTYMQVIPRLFSTDADGGDERDFLCDLFPSMSNMASTIFLKGYQWPFDAQRVTDGQSSLIDVLVFNEMQKGRRVFLDFRRNPVGSHAMAPFQLNDLEPEARTYLENAGTKQQLPIERLAHMNPLAIDIYKENGIDLYQEPLEIAVCAQHNNGGFAVDAWWQSNVPGIFVIGEMAGTHGIKRPGGSALNAGQVGGLRAAEFIAHTRNRDIPQHHEAMQTLQNHLVDSLRRVDQLDGASPQLTPQQAIQQTQKRMSLSAGHMRQASDVRAALNAALQLHHTINTQGLKIENPADLLLAVRAEHLALTAAAYLKTILVLMEQDGGSRGSYLVLAENGTIIHPDITNPTNDRPLRFKPENENLRQTILRTQYAPNTPDLFKCHPITPRPVTNRQQAFETAWAAFRAGHIYRQPNQP